MAIKVGLKGCASFMVLAIIAGCAYDHERRVAENNKRPVVENGFILAPRTVASPREALEIKQGPADVQEVRQEPSRVDEQDAALKIIKKAGWVIPGLGQSTIRKPRQPFVSDDAPQIFYTVLKPQQEIIKEFTPQTSEQKRLFFFKKKWRVDDITQYDIEYNIFCYKVAVTLVDVNEADETVTRYGAGTYIVYYDEDGDGKFETIDLRAKLAPPRVPRWLRRISN